VRLREKRIAGAGLDVYHHEPISLENPLLKLENVILTPTQPDIPTKAGSVEAAAWENIQRVASGQNPLSLARLEEV
jgi:phosphoglycerate dehydrogenase-like enzyme